MLTLVYLPFNVSVRLRMPSRHGAAAAELASLHISTGQPKVMCFTRVRFADDAAAAADADGGGKQRGKRKRGGRLPGEDDFMRLADMEAFVQQAERDAMREDEDDEDEDGDSGATASVASPLPTMWF